MSMSATPEQYPRRLLIADDSLSTKRLMAFHLERAGYQVDMAVDGLEAVHATTCYTYDLILMDIFMPRLDGLEAARRIRASEHCPGVPILALTGDSGAAQRFACLVAGMNGFLEKPLRRDALLDAVAQWLKVPPTTTANVVSPGEDSSYLLNEATLSQLERDTSPEAMPELVSLLLDESEAYVAAISEGVQRCNWAMCISKAHALKSNAGAIGADQLRQQALELEAVGLRNDCAALPLKAQLLEQTARATREAFQARLAVARSHQ